MSAAATLRMSMPPTGNHNTMVAKGRRILSPKYRAWKDAEIVALMAQRQPCVAGPYAIRFSVRRPDRRKRDLGNLEKALHDAVVQAGCVEDDSLAQKIVLEWAVEQDPAVLVTIISTNER